MTLSHDIPDSSTLCLANASVIRIFLASKTWINMNIVPWGISVPKCADLQSSRLGRAKISLGTCGCITPSCMCIPDLLTRCCWMFHDSQSSKGARDTGRMRGLALPSDLMLTGVLLGMDARLHQKKWACDMIIITFSKKLCT